MLNPFDKITDKNKEKLLKYLEASTLHFEKNSNILSSIKSNNMIGIIIEGNVQILKIDYNGDKTIIDELIENNIFGSKISSLNNNEIEMITKEDSKIIIIDYDNIINLEINNPYYNQFIKNLFNIITKIINEKNERIDILTKKTIRNRLLEYFNIYSNKHNTKKIKLPFTFTDLADYLAIDRSAMSRELKYLKEEKLIEVKDKTIYLLYK